MILELFSRKNDVVSSDAIIILGNGQYGNIAKKYFSKKSYDIYCNAEKIDINNTTLYDEINELSKTYSKVYVVNSIAITNTRTCEKDIVGSYNINTLFPMNLADAVKNNPNIILFQLSTGCIWDGNSKEFSGFIEEDKSTPLILYASQKLQGELLNSIKKEHIIIRPRMLFSEYNSPSNLLTKIDGFTELINEDNSMTSIDTINDFIYFCIQLIEKNEDIYGIYNLCNAGLMNAYRIKEILEEQKQKVFGNSYVKKNFTMIDKNTLMNNIRSKFGLSESFTLTNTIINSNKANEIFKRFGRNITQIEWEITKKCFEYASKLSEPLHS